MLWFQESEPVSIHTLASAAFQIIHDLNAKNKGEPLLFDTDWIKNEYRREANNMIRHPANFFRHAGVKKESFVEFNPALTEGFFLFGIRGLRQLGTKEHILERVFLEWTRIHKPHLLSKKGREDLLSNVPVEYLETLQSATRKEFLDAFLAHQK